jgi:hypothetical protein
VDWHDRNIYTLNVSWIQVFRQHQIYPRCLVHDFEFRKPPFSASLVKYVEEYFRLSTPNTDGSTCSISDRPPLYFQHAGHSRTIVGIERLKSGNINLILFDPSRSPSSTVKDYARGQVKQKKNLSNNVLKPFRVSMNDISKKQEYQILRYNNLQL